MATARETPALESRNTQRRIKFDQTGKELAGSIVDWCKSLSYTKIKELRLHRNSKPPIVSFYVAIVLEDESSYRLQRLKQDHQHMHDVVDSQDIIERISPTDHPSSQRLITVTFTPSHYVDFMFVLTVCHGIQCFPLGRRMVFTNDEFFAYALLSNVVRQSLRPNMANESGTELETLWKEVYLFVHSREYGFREKTIADQTWTIVQRLLRAATKEKAASFLPQGGNAECAATLASAIAWVEASACRNDAFQLSQWGRAWNNRWNQVWNNRWGEVWGNVLEGQGASMGLRALSSLGITIPGPTVDSLASGRAAGRVPVPVQARTIASISRNSTKEGSQKLDESLAQCPAIVESPIEGPTSSVTVNVPHINVIAPEATPVLPPLSDSELPSAPHTRQGLIPYPENSPIWTSTFERAVEIGWATAWESSVAHGAKAARSPEDKKEPRRSNSGSTSQSANALSRTTSRIANAFSRIPNLNNLGKRLLTPEAPSRSQTGDEASNGQTAAAPPVEAALDNHQPDVQSTTGGHHRVASRESAARSALIRNVFLPNLGNETNHHQALRESVAAKSRHRRERDQLRRDALALAKIQVVTERPDPKDLENRASKAWECVVKMANSPEGNLEDRAEQAWNIMEATGRCGAIISLGSEEHRGAHIAAWKETFKRTWEAAWKDSWKAAWQSTWEYGWKEAVAKGIESGVDEVVQDAEAEENKSLLESDSYKRVKNIIQSETTYLRSLSRMHAMCKELNQLHTTLRHSIPISHEHIMTIRVDPWKKVVPSFVQLLSVI
ncbi:hypothetical protein FRC10_004219 [Ceratobasidium sp. 414]|nr:hypothetical protein FRC10_004219 [Ceratobasidium sp. 414]